MTSVRTAAVLGLLCGLATIPGPARSDIYTWVDEGGTVHFQDEPPAPGGKVKKLQSVPEQVAPTQPEPTEAREEPAPAKQEPSPAPPQVARTEQPPAARAPPPTVELFTTSWCPYCKKARDYFTGRGIAFAEHDIERDPAALERKLGLDGTRAVPTAIIGGKVVKGYSSSAYDAALKSPSR